MAVGESRYRTAVHHAHDAAGILFAGIDHACGLQVEDGGATDKAEWCAALSSVIGGSALVVGQSVVPTVKRAAEGVVGRTYRRAKCIDVGRHAEYGATVVIACLNLRGKLLPVGGRRNKVGVVGCAAPLPCPNSLRQHEQDGTHNGR